ncbi:hypothetical protein KY362_07415 [Candidatus Woesearchaeota archaeon]|nr:hypothetical protein [Candidatus Woesearchaeota archaeon]
MNFETFIMDLAEMGVMDVVIPFVMIFALTYAILMQIRMFSKGPNVGISIVMGATPVILHVMGEFPPCWDVVVIINNSMTSIGMILIALLMFFIILGLFGFQVTWFSRFIGWIAIASFIIVGYIFLNSGGPGCDRFKIDILGWLPYAEWIIAGLFFAGVIWLVTREGRGGGGGGGPGDFDIY